MRREEVLGVDFTKVDRKLRDAIRSQGKVRGSRIKQEAYRIAFLKWVERRTGSFLGYEHLADMLVAEYVVDWLAADAVEGAVAACGWNGDCEPKAKKVFAEEALASYLLNIKAPDSKATPSALALLSARLLDIKLGENVVDFGCGVGSFLAEAAILEPKANLFGYDLDEDAVANCQMRVTVARSLDEGGDIRKPAGDRKSVV